MPKKLSKFRVPPLSSDDEIWLKILEVLSPQEKKEVSKCLSEFNEPYLSCKEVIVRSQDNIEIAFAIRSEINKKGDEWAIYREI